MNAMRPLLFSIIAVGLALPSASAAVPDTLSFQGFLRTASGNAYTGDVDIDVFIYDDETAGTLLFSESFRAQAITGGRFGLQLGLAGTFPTSAATSLQELLNIQQSDAWLTLSIDGATELPRRQVNSGMFAIRAGAADSADAVTCDACLGATHIADGAITAAKLSANSVSSPAIGAGVVDGTHLAAAAVDTASVADGAITTAKIGASAVTTALLEDGSVTSAKIADGTVATADIADGAVTEGKLSFDPATQTELDATRLNDVSGGTISNDYQDTEAMVAVPLALGDLGTNIGTVVIDEPGAILDSGVQVVVAHPHPETLDMELRFTPQGAGSPLVTIQLAAASATCSTVAAPVDCDAPDAECQIVSYDWPTVDAVASGTFDDLLGLDPTGTWELWVNDSCETYPGTDPEGTQFINAFEVTYTIFSSERVQVYGSFKVTGSMETDSLKNGVLTTRTEQYSGQSTGGASYDVSIFNAATVPSSGRRGYVHWMCHNRGNAPTLKAGTTFFAAALNPNLGEVTYGISGDLGTAVDPRWVGDDFTLSVPQYHSCTFHITTT